MVKKRKYNWDKWFSRKRSFKVFRGEDYGCSQKSMEQQIRNAANERRVSVKIIEGDNKDSFDVVILGVIEPTEVGNVG